MYTCMSFYPSKVNKIHSTEKVNECFHFLQAWLTSWVTTGHPKSKSRNVESESESPESGFWPRVRIFLLREIPTLGTYNGSYNEILLVHYCTLLCTFY